MALRLQTFAKLFRINGIRSMSSVGDFGSGAGKGGGAGGTIREAGGSFGKMEAAHEEQYIKRLIFYRHSQLSSDKFVVSLDEEQLQELKKHMQEEMKYHDQQIAQHKQAEQLKKLKDHLDEEVEHHEHSIKQHQEAIERHKKRIHDLEKTDKGSDSD